MAEALSNVNMGDNSIEVILKAINDMQDKINAEVDKKLDNYVKSPDFKELESAFASQGRRIAHNDNLLKE